MKLNKAQLEDLQQIKNKLPIAHMIDLVIHIDGREYWYEADWLKEFIDLLIKEGKD